MKLFTSTIIIAMMTGSFATTALADKPRRDFNKSVSASTAKGSWQRNINQLATDTGFIRSHQLETSDGRTASRYTTLDNDTANGTRTRSVEGRTLNNESYSGERVFQRTDNGYTQTGNFTNVNGDTATRNKVVEVDSEAGTATKTIETVGFNGETNSRTITVDSNH